MQIHKITFPPNALRSLAPDRLSAFLLLGHFVTEANWLQKLLLYATQQQTNNDAEKSSRLILALLMTKALATRLHEGWARLRNGELATVLSGLVLSERAMAAEAQLLVMLQKDSVIHRLRRTVGAHYPTSLSMVGLPNIHQSDVSLYMTRHAGDTISMISELAVVAEFNEIAGKSRVGEALGVVVDTIIRATGLYSDYLHGALIALIDASPGLEPVDEAIQNAEAIPLLEAKLRFFVTPPGAPA